MWWFVLGLMLGGSIAFGAASVLFAAKVHDLQGEAESWRLVAQRLQRELEEMVQKLKEETND